MPRRKKWWTAGKAAKHNKKHNQAPKIKIKVEPQDVEPPQDAEPPQLVERPEMESSGSSRLPDVDLLESKLPSESAEVDGSLGLKLNKTKPSPPSDITDMKPVWLGVISMPSDLAKLAKEAKVKIVPPEESIAITANKRQRRTRKTLPRNPTSKLLRYLITHVNNGGEASTGEFTEKGKPTARKPKASKKVEYIDSMEIEAGKIKFHAKLTGEQNTFQMFAPVDLDPHVVSTFMRDYSTQLDAHVLSKGTTWDKLLKEKWRSKKVGPFEWLMECAPPDFEYKCTYKEKKYEQRMELRKIECELNEAHKSVILVENEVDLDVLKIDFKPINVSVPGEGVTPPINSFQVGCDCVSCENGLKRGKCCPSIHHVTHVYGDGEIATLPKSPCVYECNNFCFCGMDCPNRVVQKGTVFALSVFRTIDGKGWGVKTLEHIPKGSFVIEYVGEIIPDHEAERRGLEYDEVGLTYLFDMDFYPSNHKRELLCIDATKFGNISRFVNHSCGPNMMVVNVWIEYSDPCLQRIAFFASRDISAGEELTFDYQMSVVAQNANAPAARKSIPCLCGSVNCRGLLVGVTEQTSESSDCKK